MIILLIEQLRTPKISLITIGVCTIFSMGTLSLLLYYSTMYVPTYCMYINGRNNWSDLGVIPKMLSRMITYRILLSACN